MHWFNYQRGWVGNDRGNCPGGTSRGSEVFGYLGDVRDKCPDTVPEWHKRNLVTLAPSPGSAKEESLEEFIKRTGKVTRERSKFRGKIITLDIVKRQSQDRNPIENLLRKITLDIVKRHPTIKRKLIESLTAAWYRGVTHDHFVKMSTQFNRNPINPQFNRNPIENLLRKITLDIVKRHPTIKRKLIESLTAGWYRGVTHDHLVKMSTQFRHDAQKRL